MLFKEEFHFSEFYRSVYYIGSHAKWMNPEGRATENRVFAGSD